MNPDLKLKKSLIVFIIIISFGNAIAQMRPMLNCFVNSVSTSSVNAGSGAGQAYPTVTVYTSPSNCTTYSISKSDTWISYTRTAGSVVISVTRNTGPERSGYVNIGGFYVTVNQACGNIPVTPTNIRVDRNNFCTNAGGDITLSVVGGSGTVTRWYSGSCGGTQVGYIDDYYITIPAPTTSTTYYARWENDCFYSDCAHVTVTVYPLPTPTITQGSSYVCAYTPGYTYQTQAGKTNYSWTVNGGSISSGGGPNDNTVTVEWAGAGSGHVKANYTENGCTALSQYDYPVTINALPSPSFTSGPNTVCAGSSGNVYITQPGKTSYSWTVTGGNITSGGGSTDNTITVNWGSAGTGHVMVNYYQNGCAAVNPTDYPVTINALPTPTISSGPTSVCSGSTGNVYQTQTGKTNYSWTIIGSASYTGGGPNDASATVTWGSAGTGHVKVNYSQNGCTAASQYDYPVTINAIPTPTISSGPTSVCSGSTGNVYTTQTGKTGYSWTIIGSTSYTGGGANDNSVTVTWGSAGIGHVKVNYIQNGCSAASQYDYPVTINAIPTPTISSGPSSVCAGSTGNVYTTQTGKSGYSWTIIGSSSYTGGGLNDNSVTVAWGNAGTGHVMVNYIENGCTATSQYDYPVTINTLPTPSISGPNSVCSGSNGNVYTTQLNKSQYSWTVDGGTPVSEGGPNDNTVTVLWGSAGTGHVKVNYLNSFGCTATNPADRPVTIKALPSIVTQPVNSSAEPNQDASFTVAATGPNLQYQWQSSPNGEDSWVNLTGLPAIGYQSASLTIKGSSSFVTTYYRCQITSDCDVINTNTVQIILTFPESGYLSGESIPDPETRVLNLSYAVGSTNGGYNVNAMGGSSYNIPIETPPGVNGLAPNLSIGYSSSGGYSIAGFGWQIGGLSTISRGPQSFYNDGSANGVNLDINDRFYLDGQRLVNTTSDYGAADAQYQTENDIFTRVTPQETDGNGPSWFKAETKSGLIYEYGNTQASKQKLNGYSQILNWYVSKISDLFGNQVNFTYMQDHSSLYPSEITYGPNTITFYYKQRSDRHFSFIEGKKIEQWLLLDKIVVKYNTATLKTYEFKQSYQGTNYNSYSILNEVIEYGTGTSRFNSTIFSYQSPVDVSFSNPFYEIHGYFGNSSKLCLGDFNGDGRADFLCIPDTSKGATWTGLKVYFSDGNNNFSSSFSSSNVIDITLLRDIRSVDLNGDGIDDIVYEYCTTPSSTTSDFYYMICNGSSFAQPVLFASQAYNGYRGLTGRDADSPETLKSQMSSDYNGDGINDIFLHDLNGNWKILSLGNSSGQLTSTLNILATGTMSTMTGDVLSGDFNGDGKSEIWSVEITGMHIYSFTGTSLNQLFSSDLVSRQKYYNLGDFNGDGKLDILLYGDVQNSIPHDWLTWQIQLSTGAGFEQHDVPQKKQNLLWDHVSLGDFNSDGATDLIVTSTGSWEGSFLYVSMNNGTGFYSHTLDYPSYTDNILLGDFNGDGNSDLISTEYPHGYSLSNPVQNASFLMAKISNGLGILTKLTYSKLSQGSAEAYDKGTGAVFPVTDFQGPWTVVSSVQFDNGKGSLNTQNYYYEGAKIHLQGKGFLGYAKSGSIDVTTGMENESISGYDLTYYYPKLLKTLSKLTGTTDTISKSSNIWSAVVLDGTHKRIFPYVQSSVQNNQLTGQSVSASTQFDSYGNPTSVIKSYSNGPTETTTNTYDNTNSASQWLLGRPESTTIQYTGGDTTITRSGSRIFDTNSNHLTSETWFAGSGNEITKSYVYNTNGTLQSQSATAGSISRSNSCTYESDNIRIHSSTDQLFHVTTNSYDSHGRLYTQQDFLGNISTFQYDAFGRQNSVSSSDGSQSTTSYSWEDPVADPVLACYSVEISGNDGSQKKSWFDILGRTMRSDVKGFDGTMIYTATVYNTKGQVESVSEPYYSGGSPLLNTFVYDDYGRKASLTRPSGKNTTWDYNENIITETTGGKSFYKTYSSDGTISSATDDGGTIDYTYYPDGKARTIAAPGGIVTRMYYDRAGNQKRLDDPSAGTIRYTYNGFGELTEQVSPGHKTTTISYLADGRISQKVTNEGTTKYRYNTNKQLRNAASPGNISKTYRYDSKGRLRSVTDTIPGSDTLRTAYAYDNLGRSSSKTHPSGITESYTYNSNGYLVSVSAGGAVRWAINAMNPRQQITSGQYKNNLSATFGYDNYGFPDSTVTGTIQDFSYNFTPTTGNLSWRQNNKHANLREDFQYDNLDRLINVEMDTTTLHMTYDSNTGGLLSKSDAGSFNYEANPYAISSIDPSTGLVPADTQVVNYTSFESISSITEKKYEADFIYNSNNNRVRMLVKQNGNAILTRWYSNDSYIKESDGSISKDYTFIGGDAYSAPAVAIRQNNSKVYYSLLRDYLGNIIQVVDSTNATVAEYSYDAWGRMRNPSTWVNYAPGSEPALIVAGRGFTGHEHLPWFNLISMNGRVYDPLTAMFLSPDNYVQNPDLTQNYNRYGYCLNNPLKYVDPTGFSMSFANWNEFWDVVDNLLDNSGGGSWDSGTGNITYYPDGGGGVVTPGSGFQGPGMPYMLGEVAVTAKVPEKNTPYSPISASQSKFKEFYQGMVDAGDIIRDGLINYLNNIADMTFIELLEGVSSEGPVGLLAGPIVLGNDLDKLGKLTRLTEGEIKMLKNAGYDIHYFKPEQGSTAGKIDLWKDTKDNIYFRPEKGKFLEPVFENLKELLKRNKK